MKKIFLVLSIILTASFVYAESDARFVSALKTCSPYESNGSREVQSIGADYKSQIVGWENNKCVYKKYVSLQGLSLCTVCKFNKYHINQIVKTMETYKTGFDEYGNEVDINNVEAIKNTPVVRLWNQYLADPSICNVEF